MTLEYIEKEVCISEIKDLLNDNEVLIHSPDGFVPINFFVDKGMWDEYVVTTLNGYQVRCNENHLFKAVNGDWCFAKDLVNKDVVLMTDKGPSISIAKKTGNIIPIVDINIDHDNHRYYTNGIESHNTGVGKSMFMCHMASANLVAGKNVLYITLEMSEERIAERIDFNLLDLTLNELRVIPKDYYKRKIDKIKTKTVGKLIIKEYPPGFASSANFRHLLSELKLKKNFIPHIIYVDYLNLCASARLKNSNNVNSYTMVKTIAEELRGLAVENDLPIVSASQSNRAAISDSDFGLEAVSESHGLSMTCDLMLALISNDELYQLNQILIKQLKNRYADLNMFKKFVVGVDRPKMRIYNLDENAQSDIVDDTPIMDKSSFGEQDNERSKPKRKFGKDSFKEFK